MHTTPDVPPNSGNAPITYQAYDYWTPAQSKATGMPLPGESYLCHVEVSGKRFCVLYKLV